MNMHLRLRSATPWVALFLAALLFVPANGFWGRLEGDGPPPGSATQARLDALEAENQKLRGMVSRMDALERELLQLRDRVHRSSAVPTARALHAYALPDTVRFCGELLPLGEDDAYRRFEAEWNRFLVNRHWLVGWMRRARDAFPPVERRLREAGLPEDLKYVMVIESAVDPRATSSAGAAGYWQFIRDTGRRYGLERDAWVDDRRDLERATGAAIAYLGELHAEFGSWPLALSAYNAGERRIRQSIEEQGTDDFYQMILPRETEAYWFKAAATKLLFEDPEAYGFALPDDGWARTVCDTLELDVRREAVAFKDLAAAAGLGYRQLKGLNPRYRKASLPRGRHRLVVPRESVEALLAAYPSGRVLAQASPTVPSAGDRSTTED